MKNAIKKYMKKYSIAVIFIITLFTILDVNAQDEVGNRYTLDIDFILERTSLSDEIKIVLLDEYYGFNVAIKDFVVNKESFDLERIAEWKQQVKDSVVEYECEQLLDDLRFNVFINPELDYSTGEYIFTFEQSILEIEDIDGIYIAFDPYAYHLEFTMEELEELLRHGDFTLKVEVPNANEWHEQLPVFGEFVFSGYVNDEYIEKMPIDLRFVSPLIGGINSLTMTKDGEAHEMMILPLGWVNDVTFTIDESASYIIKENADDPYYKDIYHLEYMHIDNIIGLSERSIMNGTGDETFSPNKNITRAEIAKIVTLGGKLHDEDSEVAFTDVTEDDWYYEYVLKIISADLVSGYPDGSFRPNDYITRSELTKIIGEYFLANGAEYPSETRIDITMSLYEDEEEIPEWVKPYLTICEDNYALIIDYESETQTRTFKGSKYVLRYEAASMIMDAID